MAIKDDVGPGGSLKSLQICGDITVQLSLEVEKPPEKVRIGRSVWIVRSVGVKLYIYIDVSQK